MDLASLLLLDAAAVLAGMTALWVVSVALGDASIVDVAWGPAFVMVASLGAGLGAGWTPRSLLVLGMVAAWGLRLALHVGRRNRRSGEDPRYARWREEHGDAWPLRSLVTVFLLQGSLVWLVSLPVQMAAAGGGGAGWTGWDVAGVVVWAGGLAMEAVADRQLRRFTRARRDPDALLTHGLWRYSRHPNYFGEAVLWWGIGMVALSVDHGWAGLAGPLAITLLVRFVSGVPLTEERMRQKQGWSAYARRTPVFVPGPPRPTRRFP